MDTKEVKIIISSPDTSTVFTEEVSDNEFNFLRKLSKKSYEESEEGSNPIILLEPSLSEV